MSGQLPLFEDDASPASDAFMLVHHEAEGSAPLTVKSLAQRVGRERV